MASRSEMAGCPPIDGVYEKEHLYYALHHGLNHCLVFIGFYDTNTTSVVGTDARSLTQDDMRNPVGMLWQIYMRSNLKWKVVRVSELKASVEKGLIKVNATTPAFLESLGKPDFVQIFGYLLLSFAFLLLARFLEKKVAPHILG